MQFMWKHDSRVGAANKEWIIQGHIMHFCMWLPPVVAHGFSYPTHAQAGQSHTHTVLPTPSAARGSPHTVKAFRKALRWLGPKGWSLGTNRQGTPFTFMTAVIRNTVYGHRTCWESKEWIREELLLAELYSPSENNNKKPPQKPGETSDLTA